MMSILCRFVAVLRAKSGHDDAIALFKQESSKAEDVDESC